MHDNLNGKITSFQYSFDQKHFFSTGVDGNLFVYSTTSMQKLIKNRSTEACDIDKFDYPEMTDILDANRLSLEQEKLMAIAQANAECVNRKKSNILEMINARRIEFDLVNERNAHLPESMRLSESNFEIDSRITEDIRREINDQMEADRIEGLVEMNRIRSKWRKIDNVLLHNVDCWAISLLGIRNNESVETFFIEKVSDNFEAIRNEFENRLNELTNGSASTQPESSEKYASFTDNDI